MKSSLVTCGECGNDAYFTVLEWPPIFYWCRYCQSVFSFYEVDSDDGVTWQLKDYPTS